MNASTYVLVRLADGTQFAGVMGTRSFASSSSEERDLLIEEVWQVNGVNAWTKVIPPRSVLLCGKDIRYIEFF